MLRVMSLPILHFPLLLLIMANLATLKLSELKFITIRPAAGLPEQLQAPWA